MSDLQSACLLVDKRLLLASSQRQNISRRSSSRQENSALELKRCQTPPLSIKGFPSMMVEHEAKD
jgi:hypothetical protein